MLENNLPTYIPQENKTGDKEAAVGEKYVRLKIPSFAKQRLKVCVSTNTLGGEVS